ncbi:recombinase family protein [Streptomyces albidoflavus]|uniref:recombinase family protein n=1 Tax=Streptomyces albidoflavus TaxID=1886 RepID=UPI001F5D29E9|nr:recombinase family protein [Streptomyces albidoflavus]
MKRLGREAAESTALAGRLTARGLVLEVLAGPLRGIYGPTGPDRLLFAFFAAMAEAERENVRSPRWKGSTPRPARASTSTSTIAGATYRTLSFATAAPPFVSRRRRHATGTEPTSETGTQGFTLSYLSGDGSYTRTGPCAPGAAPPYFPLLRARPATQRRIVSACQ